MAGFPFLLISRHDDTQSSVVSRLRLVGSVPSAATTREATDVPTVRLTALFLSAVDQRTCPHRNPCLLFRLGGSHTDGKQL